MTKTIGFRGVPYFQSRDVMAMETYGNMDMHKANICETTSQMRNSKHVC
jgi:hypothetical protein